MTCGPTWHRPLQHLQVPVIPTGSLGLDLALGIGGFPRAKMIEVFGEESAGKTTLALSFLANVQRLGEHAVYVDADCALDLDCAKKLGIDEHALLIVHPDNGEEALRITEMLLASKTVGAIAIDSVAALLPRQEAAGRMGEDHRGEQARMLSLSLRRLSRMIGRSGTCILFLNQLRFRRDTGHGSPEVTSGGRSLKFHSTVRIDLRNVADITRGRDILGKRVQAKIVKNKLAPPFQSTRFDILFGAGISVEREILEIGLATRMIDRRGTHLYFQATCLGRDRHESIRTLMEQNALRTHMIQSIRKQAELPRCPRAILRAADGRPSTP